MITSHITVLAFAFLAFASTVLAQPKEPVGRFVADVRGMSAGLPTTEGWTSPLLPSGTVVPSRGLGIEIGGHIYVLRFGGVALGVGASWLTARATESAPVVEAADGTPQPATIPDVTTRVTSLAPQVSLNFGHSLGWSYLSAGLGRSRVQSDAMLVSANAAVALDSDWVKTLNFGGGARWFINDHVGVGFDLRWHKLSLVAATATHPGAPRATMLVAGAGLVLK